MEMELTIALPCTHLRPASITLHLLESIIIGTRAISGSLAIKLRKCVMALMASSMPSSMLMSMTCAPFSTCCRATLSASSNCSLIINRAKALLPVTLVRSPTLTNKEFSSIINGSSPARRMAIGTCGTCLGAIFLTCS